MPADSKASAARLAIAVALLLAWLNFLLKELVGRSRPPEAIGFDALVGVPGSPSFPSGHAMTAFAVAGAVALLAPRLRWPVLTLAALIAFSRVYLGVHFWLDVLVGALLGLAVGLALAWSLRRLRSRQAGRQAGAASAAGTGPPGWATIPR